MAYTGEVWYCLRPLACVLILVSIGFYLNIQYDSSPPHGPLSREA
jgi:hypothetical protein